MGGNELGSLRAGFMVFQQSRDALGNVVRETGTPPHPCKAALLS